MKGYYLYFGWNVIVKPFFLHCNAGIELLVTRVRF